MVTWNKTHYHKRFLSALCVHPDIHLEHSGSLGLKSCNLPLLCLLGSLERCSLPACEREGEARLQAGSLVDHGDGRLAPRASDTPMVCVFDVSRGARPRLSKPPLDAPQVKTPGRDSSRSSSAQHILSADDQSQPEMEA